MKKTALILATLWLALCLVIPAPAEEGAEPAALESGDFRYRLLEDGSAEILGYTGKALELVLPEALDGHPVTSIGNEAFSDFPYSMEDLVIPASVTHIGSDAFSMTELEQIEIPAGVVSMEGNPFSFCPYLETVTVAEGNPAFYVQDGVLFCREDRSLVCFPSMLADPEEGPAVYTVPAGTEILRSRAFGGVEGLSEVILPDSLRVIGFQAFGFCFGLDRITLPESVTEIGDAAFDSCHYLVTAVLPAGLQRIPSMMFYECENLAAADIPESVTEIGDGAFAFCYALEEVRIPDGVTAIEASAWEACESLRSVVIPDSVQSIGEAAFASCAEDLVITCDPGSCARTYCEQNGIAFRD